MIAFDYYGTIDTARNLYKAFMEQTDCIIISAVHKQNLARLQAETQDLPAQVYPVIFTNYEDVPRLKYDVAQYHKVTLLIDDRTDTCQYFMEHGILAVSPSMYKHLEPKTVEPKLIVHHTLEEAKAYNLRRAK